MSYERQTAKWAAKKFDLNVVDIKEVRLDFEHTRGYSDGCETCGYGSDDCDCELYVVVRSKDGSTLYSGYLPAYDMPTILGEIINA